MNKVKVPIYIRVGSQDAETQVLYLYPRIDDKDKEGNPKPKAGFRITGTLDLLAERHYVNATVVPPKNGATASTPKRVVVSLEEAMHGLAKAGLDVQAGVVKL